MSFVAQIIMGRETKTIHKVFGGNEIPCNDIGRSFIKGFFVLKVYAGLMGVRNMLEVRSQ